MAANWDRGRELGADALTPCERDILARWDAGASKRAIIEATGFASTTVERVVTYYVVDNSDRLRRKSLVEANTRFVAAIAATGRRFA